MRVLSFMAALTLFTSMQTSYATTLTFDDLTSALSAVPNGYNGLNFNNFEVNTLANEQPSGYVNGTVSPSSVIFNGFGNPASFSATSGTFTLNSFYLTSAINDGLTVVTTGLLGGVVEDTETFNVSTFGPTLETLGWTGIDTVSFVSSGGTPDPVAALHYGGTQFVLDNVTISATAPVTVTPEPSSFALLGTGILGVAGMMKRRFA